MQNQNAVAVQTVNPNQAILTTIASAASNPDVDVAKMQALLEMQKDIMATQAKADYNAAMCDAQAEMERVIASRANSSTNSKFANIADVDAVARPVYTRHGFSLSFSSEENAEGFITMKCTVMHRNGHSVEHTKCGWRDDTGVKGTATKTRIQGSGSTGSYLRRYLTCEVFNIVTGDMVQSDNDGQSSEVKYITDVQRDIILEKLDRAGKTAQALCAALKVGSLAEIPAAWFDSVIARLNAPAA